MSTIIISDLPQMQVALTSLLNLSQLSGKGQAENPQLTEHSDYDEFYKDYLIFYTNYFLWLVLIKRIMISVLPRNFKYNIEEKNILYDNKLY